MMSRTISIRALLAATAAAVLLFAVRTAEAHPAQPPADGKPASVHAHPGMLSAAAEALKLDRDELRRKLKEGRTLAEIAAERGVPKDELIRRLVESAARRLDAKVAEGKLPAARADQLKTRLRSRIEAAVDSRNLLSPIHPHPGRLYLLHKVASVIGIPTGELKALLAEGRSIAEIAKSRGISEDELIGKLKDSLTDELRRLIRMKHPAGKSATFSHPGTSGR